MTKLSTETLEKFLELEKRTMPGPWYSEECHNKDCWCKTVGNKLGSDDMEFCVIPSGAIHKYNADFVAAARAIAPQAVRELMEARELLKKIQGKLEIHSIILKTDRHYYERQETEDLIDEIKEYLGE